MSIRSPTMVVLLETDFHMIVLVSWPNVADNTSVSSSAAFELCVRNAL